MSAETESSHQPSPSSSTSLADKRSSSHSSLFSTFAYPVSYTVSGLLRRIAADEAPTPLARALSANYNGSMHDPSMGVFNPPPARRLSPFQPPPLTPLTLTGFRDSTPHKSRLLNKALAEEIRLLTPPRLQLVDSWQLVYSLEQNGSSLASLYNLCDSYRGKRGGFVLTIRDSEGGVRSLSPSLAPPPLTPTRSSAPTSLTHPTPPPTTTAQANVSSGGVSACHLSQTSPPSPRPQAKTPPTSAAARPSTSRNPQAPPPSPPSPRPPPSSQPQAPVTPPLPPSAAPQRI